MMKNIKRIIVPFLALLLTFNYSCDDGLEDLNQNPNSPELVPNSTIFTSSIRRVMDESRDEWMNGRGILPWVQYSAQLNYIEEDAYQYRVANAQTFWDQFYRSAQNLKLIIENAEDPAQENFQSTSGNSQNQIAQSRIMLAYIFATLAEHFGDVPYWSYSAQDNSAFQALNIDMYTTPAYATQEAIFADILNELKLASAQLQVNEPGIGGDFIYDGDVAKWKKFANSLRLRYANRIKAVNSSANTHITEAIASGVFTSNDDNAKLSYGASSTDGSPFWAAFFVGARTDFAVNDQFIELLKGETGNYGVDPRLQKMAAPIGTLIDNVPTGAYSEDNPISEYEGMPYGLPEDGIEANNDVISFFGSRILRPDYQEVLMEYAEVEFLLSEVNGWSQDNYEAGVAASMEKWGVDPADATAFIGSLPAANEENVITQKYVALFMQAQEAWAELRRTDYPSTDILLLPGETGVDNNGVEYTFNPLEPIADVPYRLRYPLGEQSLNADNWMAASNLLSNGDELDSKLYWMP